MLSAGFQNMWQVAKFSFKALWEIVKLVTGQIGAAFTGVQRIIDGAFSRDPKKILFGIATLTKTLNENSKEAIKNITDDALSASKELEKIFLNALIKTVKRPNIELISEEDIDRGLDKIDDFAKLLFGLSGYSVFDNMNIEKLNINDDNLNIEFIKNYEYVFQNNSFDEITKLFSLSIWLGNNSCFLNVKKKFLSLMISFYYCEKYLNDL